MHLVAVNISLFLHIMVNGNKIMSLWFCLFCQTIFSVKNFVLSNTCTFTLYNLLGIFFYWKSVRKWVFLVFICCHFLVSVYCIENNCCHITMYIISWGVYIFGPKSMTNPYVVLVSSVFKYFCWTPNSKNWNNYEKKFTKILYQSYQWLIHGYQANHYLVFNCNQFLTLASLFKYLVD